MSLRQKILLFTGSTLLGLLIALAVISSVIWLDSAKRLEQQQTQQDLNRVITALSGELAALDRFTNDWAGWDDTYAFVADHNDEYIEANITDATLTQSQINTILYVDVDSQIVYSKTLAWGDWQPIVTAPEWVDYLPALTLGPVVEHFLTAQGKLF